MGSFAGWEMPLWYSTGQIKEHINTREQCALFDTCHMGEFMVTGNNSLSFWNRVLTNDISKIQDYQAQYNFILNTNGGLIDDGILYRYNEEKWMLVVNAGTIDEVDSWLREQNQEEVTILNVSDQTAKIDLQGPYAPKTLAKLIGKDTVAEFKFFRFQEGITIEGISTTISRTGYTGEIGFELYFPAAYGEQMWDILMKAGKEFQLIPAGLAARDTLRTEAGLPLSGQDLNSERVASGHPWMFAIDKDGDFIGKAALVKAEEEGKNKYIQAFRLDGKFKALPHYSVIFEESKVGEVVTGVIAPSLGNQPIGYALLDEKYRLETELTFASPDNKRVTTGLICEFPLLEITSRRKITDFLK